MASRTVSTNRISAKLQRPAENSAPAQERIGREGWTFLILPKKASAKLPSRGQVTVDGLINGAAFRATLQPDGNGGHWLKVDRKLSESLRSPGTGKTSGLKAGDVVTLEITPVAPDQEPEPDVPADLRKALASASKTAREVWADITPKARQDWVQWVTSGKKAETRVKRIATACDMLAKGKRRPCCFDRSGGMYSSGGTSMSCPVADDE
jgi:hypothetical protein